MKTVVHFASSISAAQFPFNRLRPLRGLRPTFPKHAIKHPASTNVLLRICAERISTNQDSVSSGFDLAHSIALAGCSFEAYRDPVSTYELSHVSANGTVTSYTNREFVAENFDGLIQVHLQSASGLPSRDLLGKSDPYIIANIAGSSATSSIKAQTLDPVWDEVFYLYVKDRTTSVLTFRLFDADALKSDDSLGVAKFPLKKLSIYETNELELPLIGDGGGGILYASIQLLPFESVDEMGSVGAVDGFEEIKVEEEEEEDPLPRGLQLSEISDAWRALARMAGKRAEEEFDPVCFIENVETDTQVWIYRNVEKKECVIAFRGTEQIKWKDLMTDANIDAAIFDIERSSSKDSILTSILNRKSCRELLVHRGFLTAYDSIKTMVFTVAEMITKGVSNWTVYTTGHSLGGALATLCAFELASRWMKKPPEVKMYNFGSPRVGNQIFAEEFNQMVSESWRIISRKDLVTTVPRLAGYCHVRKVVVLNKDGSLEFEGGDKKDVFEGRNVQEVVEEVSSMLNEEEGFEQVGRKVLDYELELVSRLVDGSGLDEHMEENYLSCLRCSIGNSYSSEDSVEMEA